MLNKFSQVHDTNIDTETLDIPNVPMYYIFKIPVFQYGQSQQNNTPRIH